MKRERERIVRVNEKKKKKANGEIEKLNRGDGKRELKQRRK